MSEQKHTPGPWSVVDGYYPGFLKIIGPSFEISVVTTATDLDFKDFVARTNDCQLIAAAPELLAALELTRENLRACQATIHLCGGFDPAYVNDAQAAMKVADAAMAKARGES